MKCANCGQPATRKNTIGEPCCALCGETYDALDSVMDSIFESLGLTNEKSQHEFHFNVAPELQALGYPSDTVVVVSCCVFHASKALERTFIEMFGEEAMLDAKTRASQRLEAQRHAHLN